MPPIISHIKELRLAKGLTQDELAQKLGVTRQTVNAIEQGKYEPTLLLAYRCAKFFSTPIEKIFLYEK